MQNLSQRPPRRILFAIFAIALAGFLSVAWASSHLSADTVQTSAGPLVITPIGHGSVMLSHGGKVIHVDPTAATDYTGAPQADLILITDVHGDHQDPEMVSELSKSGTIVVAPAAVQSTVTQALPIANGEKSIFVGIEVEAVPMYNLTRGPAPGKLFHDKGRGNGYILTLGGKRVYLAGDTACTPEMKALANIDIAFIPMNLPYTMPPDEAAACAKAFQPGIVYPYHFRGSDLDEFSSALAGTPGVEVRIRKWYE